MFDANESYDPATAITFANMVADNDLSWFEEPCASRTTPQISVCRNVHLFQYLVVRVFPRGGNSHLDWRTGFSTSFSLTFAVWAVLQKCTASG